MTRKDILTILAANAPALRRDFAVVHLSLFGSYARNEARADSDVDILVEFAPNAQVGLFAFLKLKSELERLLGHRVNLATVNALHPAMKSQILREAVLAA